MQPSVTSGALMIAGAIGIALLWKNGYLDGVIASATSLVKAGPNVPKKTAGTGIGGHQGGQS
jgi:hypothetical protein